MASRLPATLFALIIGINEYLDKDTPDLKGAAADADSIARLLIEKGVPPERIRNLRNKEATRVAIRKELTDLIANPDISKDDPVLIYFAGHGNNNPAPDEWTNWDQYVQCLVPHDFNEPDGKGGIIHGIPDRALGTILQRIAKAKGNNITVILDCCHSGSGTRNVKTLVRSAPPSSRPLPADIDEDLFSFTRGAHVLPKFRHHGIESHILLAACKLDEVAHEYQGQGQFTGALLAAFSTLDLGSVTYSELVRQLKVLPYQNPQCEGKVDRLLFSNDLRTMKGYYPAKLEIVKEKVRRGAKNAKTEEKTQLRVEAGLVHEITPDTVFDIWPSLLNLSDPPLATCKATNVTSLRTIVDWKVRADVQPPQTLIAKPHKSPRPTLKYHISEDFKDRFNSLLESPDALRLPFCLSETTKELADVTLSAISESLMFEILAPEEGLAHERNPRELGPLDDVWDFLKALAFFYHKLRHDNTLPANIVVGTGEHKTSRAFISMFDLEVYRLDDETGEPISDNLNIPEKGVHLFIEDDEEVSYGFKITNSSTFGVYPHLFYFNSYSFSIEPFYTPVNIGNQKVDQPLKPEHFLTVGWGPGGTAPQSFCIDEDTEVENGFLKLYITQEYVDLGHIEQAGFDQHLRGTQQKKLENKSQEFWGTIKIPFVLERKQDGDDDHATRGVEEEKTEPTICLLGTKNAKASLLQDLFASSNTKQTENFGAVDVHKLSLKEGSRITLIDIPAFEDSSLDTNVTLCQSLLRFFTTYGADCSAFAFAYDISKSRVEQVDVLNFGLIKDLCGDASSNNAAIITTNWPRGTPNGSFEKRESELRTRPDYCHGLIKNGAQLRRCTSDGSTSRLLSEMASHNPIPLGIQIEARCNMPMKKTGVGASLRTRLHASIEGERKRCKDMEEELEDTSGGWDDPLPEDEVEAIREDLRAAQAEMKKLKEILNAIEPGVGRN